MSRAVTLPEHYSENFEADETGWWTPECACGWKGDPTPSAEDCCDALMDHVEYSVHAESKRERERWSAP